MIALRPRLLAALLALCTGCALLGKGKPLALRYFDLQSEDDYRPTAHVDGARLRLGQVRAARHIDRRFASRERTHELSYRDAWRFSDQPEAFLERALTRNLFERAAVTRVMSGAAATLEVELTAFERRGETVQVTALARVHDDRVQLWQRRFSAEQKVEGGDEAEALAEALSRALAQVAAQITEQTLQALASTGSLQPAAAASSEPAATLAQPPR